MQDTAPPFDLAKLPSLLALEREICMRSLYEFAKRAWSVLEPGRKFKDNWHIKLICDHLEAVSRGEIRRLLINVPPRHMKSLLVSVIWPVWDWLKTPTRQFLTASYVQKLSTRDALKSRQLIQSPWFQARFGDLFQLGKDQNEKQRYQNSKMGYRIAISTSGGVGEGGDFLIADDPQNTDEMTSDAYVEATTDWWNGTFNQRLNDQNDGAIVLTMQRLSERDLCEQAIQEGGWVHLMIPAEFEVARKCVTPWGEDPRTQEGELLWPNRIGAAALTGMKKRLGSYGSAGQLQQRPAPRGGGTLKSQYLRKIKRDELPAFFHYILTLDTAATQNVNNDPTGAVLLGLSCEPNKQGIFKLAHLEEWLNAPQLERRIPALNKEFGKPGLENLIECAGPTGIALYDLLREKLPHLIMTRADPKDLGGDKDARANLAAIILEQGLCWEVEGDTPEEEEKNVKFREKFDAFPKSKPRDAVDAWIQGVLYSTRTYTFEPHAFEYEGGGRPTDTDGPEDDDDDDWKTLR